MIGFFKKILLIALCARCSAISYAGGSSYSRYGIGDILNYGNGKFNSLSGTGIALIDDEFINGLNPAGMARLSLTRFSGGFEYSRYISDDRNGSSIYSIGKLQELSFAFPVSKENGIVLSTGLTPYSMVNYSISSSVYDSISGLTHHQTFYGSGGLSTLNLALSVSPWPAFYAGARLNYIYGKTRQFITNYLDDPAYVAPSFDRTTYYSGFTFTFGLIYENVGKLIGLQFLDDVSFGFTATTPVSLDADEQKSYAGAAYGGNDSTIIQNGTVEIPPVFGIGITYTHEKRYRFLGDLVLENWENAKFFSVHPDDIRNSYRTSFGFELVPVKGADSYWDRIAYRAGVAYHSTYYKIHGTGINELLISGGIGVPFGTESKLNIGLQYVIRGTTDSGLQKDNIFRISLGISASELWFQNYEED